MASRTLCLDLANPKCDPVKLKEIFRNYCFKYHRDIDKNEGWPPRIIVEFWDRLLWKWLWWHLRHSSPVPYLNMDPEIEKLAKNFIKVWKEAGLITESHDGYDNRYTFVCRQPKGFEGPLHESLRRKR